MGGHIKKLAGQTVYYGLSSIVGRILNFFLVPLYVRTFTEGDYGVYTNIYAYFTFLNILYTYGMETAYFRFVNQEKNPLTVFSTSTWSLTATTALFSAAIFLYKDGLCALMGYAGHPEYILWILTILALDTLAVTSFASLRQQERPLKFAAIKIANILINVGCNLFFLVLCPYILSRESWASLHPLIYTVYSPDIGIGYIFISNIIASAATLVLLFGELSNLRLHMDMDLLKRMLIYAGPLVVVGFAGMINDNLDRTLLKHLLPHSPEENDILLGIYGANAKLSVFMVLVIQAFKFAAEPFFFQQAGQRDAKQTYADVMLYFMVFGLLIFLFVSLNLDVFKYLVGRAGSRYHEGLFIVPVLLLANLFLGIFYNLSIWYKLKDKTGIGAYVSVAGAVITIVFNILWVPRFGYAASAYTKLICYVSMVYLSYRIGQRVYPIAYRIRRMAVYLALALAIQQAFSLLHGRFLSGRLFVSLAVGNVMILLFFAAFIRIEKFPLKKLLRI